MKTLRLGFDYVKILFVYFVTVVIVISQHEKTSNIKFVLCYQCLLKLTLLSLCYLRERNYLPQLCIEFRSDCALEFRSDYVMFIPAYASSQ